MLLNLKERNKVWQCYYEYYFSLFLCYAYGYSGNNGELLPSAVVQTQNLAAIALGLFLLHINFHCK